MAAPSVSAAHTRTRDEIERSMRRESLNIADQLNAEVRSSGLTFRIMLVGESGLGKSTFTRALLRPFVPENLLDAAPLEPIRTRTEEIQEIVHKVENDGFPVEFTIVDCPGYGDSIDATSWIDRIVAHVTGRFETHYDEAAKQAGVNSAFLQRDGLVHVCLYFIAAHRLKGIDIEFMQRLQRVVNVVVVAKSDTMTLAERDAFRRLVLAELREKHVQLFQLSGPRSRPSTRWGVALRHPRSRRRSRRRSHDAAAASASAEAATRPRPLATTQPPPFAVCASEDGTRVYPWGTCCVEDPSHSDLSVLRSMLFASSMLAAKRRTLELFESSYASARRADEATRAAREARALWRERPSAASAARPRRVGAHGAVSAVAVRATRGGAGCLQVLAVAWERARARRRRRPRWSSRAGA